MNIQCKRVYDPAEQSDGYRVLVDRLWPRGIKKTDLALDEWDKEITPSTELRKAFHGEVVDFATFREQYLAELAQHEHEGKRHDDAPEIALERDLRLPPREEKGGAEQDTPSRDVYQLSQTFDRGRLWCVIHLIILFSATQI